MFGFCSRVSTRNVLLLGSCGGNLGARSLAFGFDPFVAAVACCYVSSTIFVDTTGKTGGSQTSFVTAGSEAAVSTEVPSPLVTRKRLQFGAIVLSRESRRNKKVGTFRHDVHLSHPPLIVRALLRTTSQPWLVLEMSHRLPPARSLRNACAHHVRRALVSRSPRDGVSPPCWPHGPLWRRQAELLF